MPSIRITVHDVDEGTVLDTTTIDLPLRAYEVRALDALGIDTSVIPS